MDPLLTSDLLCQNATCLICVILEISFHGEAEEMITWFFVDLTGRCPTVHGLKPIPLAEVSI